jgi:putative acetyltransferase
VTSQSRFAFHPFAHAHLPELVDLWIDAWSRTMPSIDFEARRAWFVDHLVSLIDAGTQVCLAFDPATGSMAGFVTLEPRSGHVDQLAVGVPYWGTRCGGALLAWAKAETQRQGCDRLWVDVNQDNPRAVRFYEREGFRRLHEGVNPTSGLRTWRHEWRRGSHGA